MPNVSPGAPSRTLALNVEAWDTLCNAHGYANDAQRAVALGFSPISIWRLQRGDRGPGARFIAAVTDLFGQDAANAVISVVDSDVAA